MPVTVGIGQCGCQVLHDTLSRLYHEDGSIREGDYFAVRRKREVEKSMVARAVLVDTEPKAVEGIVDSRRTGVGWSYDIPSMLGMRGGGGGASNNFAHGYLEHGPQIQEPFLEAIRRHIERVDVLDCVVTFSSAAGGTGSGLGAFCAELLEDTLPRATRLSCVVCPMRSGEVSVQGYNSCFSLSRLAAASQCVLIIENEDISTICSSSLKIERPSIFHLNAVIASQLSASLFLPAHGCSNPGSLPSLSTVAGDAHFSRSVKLGTKVRHIVPHMWYPFAKVTALPQVPEASKEFGTDSWKALTRRLCQMHTSATVSDSVLGGSPRSISMDRNDRIINNRMFNHSIATVVTARGHGSSTGALELFCAFENPNFYSSWSPQPLLPLISDRSFDGIDRVAAVVSNGKGVVGALESVTTRAQEMYAAGAYVHQYTTRGLEKEDFNNSFVAMENFINVYQRLK